MEVGKALDKRNTDDDFTPLKAPFSWGGGGGADTMMHGVPKTWCPTPWKFCIHQSRVTKITTLTTYLSQIAVVVFSYLLVFLFYR